MAFLSSFFGGIFLLLVQATAAFFDGYAFPSQLKARGVTRGYAFIQHGGMWADLLLLIPLVSYLVSSHSFAYTSVGSIILLALSFLFWVVLTFFFYVHVGERVPGAHAHDGHVTVAGVAHIIFASLVTWILAMVYLPGLTNPAVSSRVIIIVFGVLTLWAYLGVRGLSKNWRESHVDEWQIDTEIVFIWLLALLHIFFF